MSIPPSQGGSSHHAKNRNITNSIIPNPSRIVFGSCHSQHHHHETTTWPAIRARHAAAWVWAGDAVYADDFERTGPLSLLAHRDATPVEHAKLLRQLAEQDSGYRNLIRNRTTAGVGDAESSTPLTVLGAWDDHDFGANNGDYRYVHRIATAEAYLDFLEAGHDGNGQQHTPTNLTLARRRARKGHGVYSVKVLDFARPWGDELLTDREAGIDADLDSDTDDDNHNLDRPPLSNRSVAIFTLDVRSNKTPWRKGFLDKFAVSYEDDFLGEAQWDWLERSLARSTAAVNLIVQGLQVHSDRFVNGNLVEDWSRFPAAQHRLYQTILKTPAPGAPILVSGDVHMAELLRKDCKQRSSQSQQSQQQARILLEVTSSGLTHSWGTQICARPYSRACNIPHIGRSLSRVMHFAHRNGAWTELVHATAAPNNDDDNGRVQEGAAEGPQYSLELNFGEFEFDWEARAVIIRIHGIDETRTNNKPYLSTRWDLDALAGKTTDDSNTKHATSINNNYHQHSERDYAWALRDLLRHGKADPDDFACVAYHGPQTVWRKTAGYVSSGLLASVLMGWPVLVAGYIMVWVVRRSWRSLSRDHRGRQRNSSRNHNKMD